MEFFRWIHSAIFQPVAGIIAEIAMIPLFIGSIYLSWLGGVYMYVFVTRTVFRSEGIFPRVSGVAAAVFMGFLGLLLTMTVLSEVAWRIVRILHN